MNAEPVDNPLELRQEIRLLERALSLATSAIEREPIEAALDERRVRLREHYVHVRTLRTA